MGRKRMPVRFQALFDFTSGDHLMARSTRDQRSADDRFRSSFLWGRKPLLAACAARLQHHGNDLIWVDLGGGTGVSMPDLQRSPAATALIAPLMSLLVVTYCLGASGKHRLDGRVHAVEKIQGCVCGRPMSLPM